MQGRRGSACSRTLGDGRRSASGGTLRATPLRGGARHDTHDVPGAAAAGAPAPAWRDGDDAAAGVRRPGRARFARATPLTSTGPGVTGPSPAAYAWTSPKVAGSIRTRSIAPASGWSAAQSGPKPRSDAGDASTNAEDATAAIAPVGGTLSNAQPSPGPLAASAPSPASALGFGSVTGRRTRNGPITTTKRGGGAGRPPSTGAGGSSASLPGPPGRSVSGVPSIRCSVQGKPAAAAAMALRVPVPG
mmetsp:Transcript_4431/g.18830  ORF Transcript_4431/g.18830 Transcript_4431/m.18830 type:complete len:246 (+) Transcript_4431:360-1097(+)